MRSLCVDAVSLMDQQQVDVLRLQLAQALVDALVGALLASVRDPHLRHEEQVFASIIASSIFISQSSLSLSPEHRQR